MSGSAPSGEAMTPEQRSRRRREFLQRLGYYLVGISIGLVLLGFFQMRRNYEARQREIDRAKFFAPASPAPVGK